MAYDFTALNDACLDVFGGEAIHAPLSGGGPHVVRCVIDSGEFTETSSPGAHIVLWAKAESFGVEPAKGDTFTHGGVDYTAADVQREPEDGAGLRVLLRYKWP
jgi:hypothetical protein